MHNVEVAEAILERVDDDGAVTLLVRCLEAE
jgi:hypothetical protein